MLQRLTRQLPLWARPEHPVLRYELGKVQRAPRRVRLLRALGIILLALALVVGSYVVATGFLTRPLGQSLTESLSAIVLYPLLILQVITRVAAVGLTANVVSEEARRQNWDNIRATPTGAELALRASWAAVFYRLRALLGIILVVRIILIFGILYDLTAFQGRYLDLLINGILPEVPLVAGVLLLSLLMTASLLLPITGIGFDAALGLLLSTFVRQRMYNSLLLMLIILFRIALVIGLAYLVSQFVNGALDVSDSTAWLLVGAYGAMGDWGLAFLNLGFYGEIWATVPYGILLGLGLLVYAMLQAMVTDQLLALAVRRAERRG